VLKLDELSQNTTQSSITLPMALESPSSRDFEEILSILCHVTPPVESQFPSFREFYDAVVCSRRTTDATVTINAPILSSHRDVLRAVSMLRESCAITREQFQQAAFPGCKQEDADVATRAVVRLAFMFDPASKSEFSSGYKVQNEESFPVMWQPKETLTAFVQSAFPTSPRSIWPASTAARSLKAWKLKQRHGLRILPTNDLVQHLLYNPRSRTLSVFHHVEYLKAQIRYTADQNLNEKIEMSLKRSDTYG
jgi:hypothetical protein